MYIYWEEIFSGHMRKILDDEKWSLYCGPDKLGYECLYLKFDDDEDEYCICDSDYYMQGQPNLDTYYVGEYFTEVVKTVFRILAEETPQCIDLEKIQEQVLEPFWKEWTKKGFVED